MGGPSRDGSPFSFNAGGIFEGEVDSRRLALAALAAIPMLRCPVPWQAINDLNAGGIFLALDRTDVGAVNVSAVRKLFRDKPAACLSLRRLIAMSPGFPCTGKATGIVCSPRSILYKLASSQHVSQLSRSANFSSKSGTEQMTGVSNPLEPAEYQAFRATGRDKERLTHAGDLLAAMHIDHALQCLDPENPLHQQAAAQA
jgi:hypothetical protein